MPESPPHTTAARPGFAGRPSLQARISAPAFGFWRTITGVVGLDLGSGLNALMASRRPPRLVTRGLTVQHHDFHGWDLWTLRCKSPSGKNVLAVHGGAFVCEATVLHWGDYAAIARDTRATVLVPCYPLAPRGTAGTVVPQMADLITELVAEYGPDNVSIYGDSAGGGIALSAVQELVRRGETVPAGMVLLSPVVDASLSNPAIRFVNDPVLNIDVLKANFARWAADLDLTDPLVSPLYGSLSGLPPTAVYAGSLEILAPDAIALQEKSSVTPDANFTFDLRTGVIHDWAMTSWLPEARAVRSRIHQQLRCA